MYEQFFGLTERPFDLTPDWRYLYLTPMHREALVAIQYGVTARRGIVVVVGEAGTGKTTVVRSALRALRTKNVRHVYLSNPMLTRAEFMKFLAHDFKLSLDSESCKTDLLSELTAKLTRLHSAGRAAVLVVDEAQSMPHELFEEIRLLANIETRTAKLLQVVILGQPELADRLNEPSLRQLKQRVAIRSKLKPLDLRATAALIAGRIRVAGGKPADIFTPRAVELIYVHSGGVPRTINVICDNALVGGFGADVKPVGADVIEDVCREFDLPALVNLSVSTPETSGSTSEARAVHQAAAQSPRPVAVPRPVAHEPHGHPKIVAGGSRHDAAAGPRTFVQKPEASPRIVTTRPHVSTADPELFPAYGKRRLLSFLGWGRG
jgi:general secretion pathway protein A